MTPAIETPRAAQLGRTIGLTVLLTSSGWLVLGTLIYFLDELGLKAPKLNAGVGVAAAGVGAVIFIGFALLAAIVLIAAGVFAVVRERRNPAAWQHAALAAAIAIAVPSLLLLFDGPNPNVFLSVGVPVGALAVGSRFNVTRPFLVSLAAPALGMLILFVRGAIETSEDLSSQRDSERTHAVEIAADGHDSRALQLALEDLPSRNGPELDWVLVSLVTKGHSLAEVDVILKHPKTPPTMGARLLRASADGDVEFWRRRPEVEPPTLVAAANLAARRPQPEVLQLAARAVKDPDQRVDVLDQLVACKDTAAAERWLGAAGMSGDGGTVRVEVMTSHFLDAMWHREDRSFYWEHADPDRVLVAVAANGGYPEQLQEALKHGAHVNAHAGCGATALTALATGINPRRESITALLVAAADPNLPGTKLCFDGEPPPPPAQTPLWHLVLRRKDWNALTSGTIGLMMKYGADATRPGSDGGTLLGEAADDEPTVRALKGLDRDNDPGPEPEESGKEPPGEQQ